MKSGTKTNLYTILDWDLKEINIKKIENINIFKCNYINNFYNMDFTITEPEEINNDSKTENIMDIVIEKSENEEKKLYENDIEEIAIKDLEEIVNIRCLEVGEPPVKKLYNSKCPICFDYVNKNNWILLHPCSHIICKTCSPNISHINNSIRIPCPLCKIPCKWINNTDNNLRNISYTVNVNTYDDSGVDENLLMFLPIIPISRQRTIGYPGINIHDDNNIPVSYNPIDSKPPISTITFLNQNNIIKSEYFNILYKENNIGSLIISSNNIENICNGKDYIFLIDNSGSMERTIGNIKNNLISLISNLTPRDRVSIIFFDTHSKQLFALQPMTATIKEQVCKIISDEHIGGSTNYKDAFLLLKKVMKEGYIIDRQMIIIFGSDGIPDIGYEGVFEIQDLYNADIPFQIYSCSFGGDVSATVLQSILKTNNQENYRHFGENNQFQFFIKNVLECDNSNIIASSIKIICKNVKPLSSQTVNTIEENTYETNIGIFKSIDFVSFPLEFIDLENFEIKIIYKNLNNESIELECSKNPIDCNYIIHSYNYKKIINIINDLNENMIISANVKILELENIKISIIDSEDYGNFLSEIMNLLNKSIEYLSQPSLNLNYNNYNNIRQISANMTSCRGTSIGPIFPIIEQDVDE
jgi:hypothetical protein